MESSKIHKDDELHFFFFPFMAQGHVRPAIDMAKLFASRGQRSTIITTSNFARSIPKLLRIEVVTVKIPFSEVGLPEGTDSLHATKDTEEQYKFVKATTLLAPQLEDLLRRRRHSCLVADMFFPWSGPVATRCGAHFLLFHGTSYFSLCASLSVYLHKPYQRASTGSEPFLIPHLPDEIFLTPDKLPDIIRENQDNIFAKLYDESKKAELASYGVLVNTFYELEPAYAHCYTEVLGVNKAWHIGPLSLYNEDDVDETADEHGCLKWLDSKKLGSVIYLCFGSLSDLGDAQLAEIAAGLEASRKEFLWVVKKKKKEAGEEEWLPKGFEKRMEERGMIIRGWAPQVKILGHESIGGFVTHCGWNSILEGICSGVTMATWPLFAEQFYNEKLMCQVLGVGAEVGVTKWSRSGGDLVGREAVERAVNKVMEGEEAERMRTRVKKLAQMARTAVREGGSSYLDLDTLFRDLRSHKLATADV